MVATRRRARGWARTDASGRRRWILNFAPGCGGRRQANRGRFLAGLAVSAGAGGQKRKERDGKMSLSFHG